MKLSSLLLGTCGFLALGIGAAFADKANNSLNLAFPKELEAADVYFNTSREGSLMNLAVWDGLLLRDPKTGAFSGNLATEWTWIDDLTVEFKLRSGVTFHNGAPFGADDVVATVAFITDPANAVKNTQASALLDHAEKVDDLTVRLVLKAPSPVAEEYIASSLPIYPHAYYAEVGPVGMNAHPVGTGPFEVAEIAPGKDIVLRANPNYFDGAKPAAKVDTITIRTVPDLNTQIAEFFNGRLDLLWGVPSDQAEKLQSLGRFDVTNAPAMRIGYLMLDAVGKTDPDGPMTKQAVRQAIYHAIDRRAIVDALLKGGSQVIDSACSPAQIACVQDLPTYDYDPAKAKELLAQAGYPDGFTIDFYAYRDRPIAEAIMGYLNKVGIRTKLNYMQYAALRDKAIKDGVAVNFQTWGSNSVADASASAGQFFSGGADDTARDAQVTDWINEADQTMDPTAREGLYKQALTRVVEEAYWVPLFTYNVNYAMNKDLDFTPTEDELVRFYDISWK